MTTQQDTTLRVRNLDTVDEPMLDRFFKNCADLGYTNNVSKESIRVDYVRERKGNIWFLIKQDEIIGMAGCHLLTKKAYRIQFRGCELPGTDVKPGLSRSHFNSSTFRELIPFQLKWIEQMGYDKHNIYLTVNNDNRNHRAMSLIEQQGFLTREHEYASNLTLFDTEQTLWKFITSHYEEVREKIKSYVV